MSVDQAQMWDTLDNSLRQGDRRVNQASGARACLGVSNPGLGGAGRQERIS